MENVTKLNDNFVQIEKVINQQDKVSYEDIERRLIDAEAKYNYFLNLFNQAKSLGIKSKVELAATGIAVDVQSEQIIP